VRRLTPLLAASALAIVLAACGSDDPPAALDGLDTRTVTVGEVEVTITPTRLEDTGASFTVAFDTHSVDLDLDIADTATLTVDGQAWTDPSWNGPGPGGHHREGTLTFTAAGRATGDAVLTIEGLDEPATARWALPERA
jgi:heat shock protein HslJ